MKPERTRGTTAPTGTIGPSGEELALRRIGPDAPLGYVSADGQLIEGRGLLAPGQRAQTRPGQPLIYSVGPDGVEDGAHVA